jgi:hypothetical protein
VKTFCIGARPTQSSGRFELKVFLPKKGDGFIVTSQAKAGEVLDVYAVEFSKTAPRSGYPRKRPPLMEAPRKK